MVPDAAQSDFERETLIWYQPFAQDVLSLGLDDRVILLWEGNRDPGKELLALHLAVPHVSELHRADFRLQSEERPFVTELLSRLDETRGVGPGDSEGVAVDHLGALD